MTFTLPTLTGGAAWGRVVDTQSSFDADPGMYESTNIELVTPDPVPGTTYVAQGTTIVILEALP